MLNIVVIGGSAAGPKAAAKARRMDRHARITLVQKSPDLSMSSCGYPYFVGGVVPSRQLLLGTATTPRDARFFHATKDIRALTLTEAVEIDRQAKTVTVRALETGATEVLPYDRLVIATGSTPIVPRLPGVDLEGVTTLQCMEDADCWRAFRDQGGQRPVVIVGGGLIGMETAEALTHAGFSVTVVEARPQTLGFLDPDLAKLAEQHAESKGVSFKLGVSVTGFEGEGGVVTGVTLSDGTALPAAMVLLSVGVRPNVELARRAGLAIGPCGGIAVDAHLATSDPNIYACGDCVELRHRLTDQPTVAFFGDLANLEGRVVGRNAVAGPTATFPGTVQTGICQLFDWTVGSTGLTPKAAKAAGFDPIWVTVAGSDKPGFMGAQTMILRLVADRASGRLLGLQGVGPGDVSKRLAIAATGLHAGMTIEDFETLDLPYAPPYSPAIDPIIAAAHVLEAKRAGQFVGISAVELYERLSQGERPLLVDTRNPDEFAQSQFGWGERLLPLPELAGRVAELPADKTTEIICFCRISARGYEAARLLESRGYQNVKVLEGGLVAWPFGKAR